MPIKIKPYDMDQYNIKINGKETKTNLRLISRTLNAIKKGYSPLILVVGDKGIGKSFTACWLAYKLMMGLGKKMDIKKNCVYTLEQAINLIDNNELEVIILDEMIELGYRREHYKKSHIHFVKILNTQRVKRMIYIMVIPYASDIDRSFAKHIDLMVFVKKRGVCITYMIPKRYTDFAVKDGWQRPVEKFTVKKSDVPTELWEEYEAYSFDMKQKINAKINDEILKKSMFSGLDIKLNPDKIIEMLENPVI